MFYDDDVLYRPPMEADSVLLEVASGCYYAKCGFCECSSAHRKSLRVVPLEQVRANTALLGSLDKERKKESAFLLGETVLAFQTEYLKEIFGFLRSSLPNIKKISMFARAVDVNHKSDRQLSELKALGLGVLYIGLESGSDAILDRWNKGESTAEMLCAFRRLDALGIPYSLTSICGLGGKDRWEEHALLTAELYNQIHPQSIRLIPLTPIEGTQLYREVQEGTFCPLELLDILKEELYFLRCLEVDQCLFIGTHLTHTVPFTGMLSQHKQILLDMITSVIESAGTSTALSAPLGGSQY